VQPERDVRVKRAQRSQITWGRVDLDAEVPVDHEVRAILLVFSEVVHDVGQSVPRLSRQGDALGVVAVGEHDTPSARPGLASADRRVEVLGRRDLKALHPHRQGGLVVGLDQQMDVRGPPDPRSMRRAPWASPPAGRIAAADHARTTVQGTRWPAMNSAICQGRREGRAGAPRRWRCALSVYAP
jgi:hypothetical protein